ncbi:MAG: Spore coat protein CotH [Verrucomicrobiales bacterium]|nr:Spore coat protein CotH [Verrucomicrobiales bacterium]
MVLLLNLTASGQVLINEICADNGGVLSPGGTKPDYVELYNAGTSSVTLSNWFLTDDNTVPKKWGFPNTATIAAKGHVVVWLDTTNNYPGFVSTNFSFRSSGEEIGLYQGSTKKDSLVFGRQLKNNVLCRYPSGGALWTLGLPTPGATNKYVVLGTPLALRINEIMATNSLGDDWLELYNPATNPPVNIGGMVFSDTNTATGRAGVFTNSFIDSGDFMIFLCSGDTLRGDHLGFKLSSTLGETITLYASNRITIVDKISFGPQQRDHSYGRLPDGGTNLFSFDTNRTTQGGPNDWLSLTNIVVNEILTHTDPPFEDAFELFNPTDQPVDISDWWVSNSRDVPLKFHIPAGTVIPAGGYKLFFEQVGSATPGFNRSGTGSNPDFTFNSAHGDEFVLTAGSSTAAVTGARNVRVIPASANAVAFTRYVKSNGGTDLVPESQRTFGHDNPPTIADFRLSTGLPNAYPLVGPLVITEIMYNPPDVISGGITNDNALDEYVELTSLTNGVLRLYDIDYPTNTWHLEGGVGYTFPTNISVAPKGTILLVNFDPVTNLTQVAAFRSKYNLSTNTPMFGPYAGKLNNSGDSVELYKPDPVQVPPHPDAGYVPSILVEKVKYDNTNGWTLGAKGTGQSLQRVSLTGYANDATNWVAAYPGPGTIVVPDPPAVAPQIATQPSTTFVIQGTTGLFSVEATGTAPLHYQWRFNANPIPGANASSYTVASALPENTGYYDVVITNQAGTATSDSAFLLVLVPPYFVTQPSSQAAAQGTTVTLGVYVTGTEPLNYQWQFSPVGGSFADLAGKTDPTLTLGNVQDANAGNYRVMANNFAGQATSAVAALTIGTPPQIVTQPQDQFVTAGTTVTLTLSSSGTSPIVCQWRKDGVDVSDVHTTDLVLHNVQTNDSGSYQAVLTNSFGSVTSVVALVSVAAPPYLLSLQKMTNGSTSVLFDGTAGHVYELQGTTNFVDWSVIKRFTNSLGRETITDLTSTNLPFRVYRGVLAP